MPEPGLAAQWPMAEKRQRADLIIDNRGSPEELSKNVEQLNVPAFD